MSRVLITGVYGCIGAWAARRLVADGHEVIGTDVSDDDHRHADILHSAPGYSDLYRHDRLDVADRDETERAIAVHRPDAVIHLAALQIPFCRADPVRCADVNIRGVMNLFEVARELPFQFVYASSCAAYGPGDGRPHGEHENLAGDTLYGVLKRAAEDMGRIYAQDWGVPSVCLRPWIVYGPGRDQGITADLTLSLAAAAQGHPSRIRFSGPVVLNHSEDIADAFVMAALVPRVGHAVHTIVGPKVDVAEFVAMVEDMTATSGLIEVDTAPLGISADAVCTSFADYYGSLPARDLRQGIIDTLAAWGPTGRG